MAEEQKQTYTLKVCEEKKKGAKGDYTVKYVYSQNQKWNVGKKDLSKVDVGKEYLFTLATSEWNGTTYHWANLQEIKQESQNSITNEDVKAYFLKLDVQNKKAMLKWLVENF